MSTRSTRQHHLRSRDGKREDSAECGDYEDEQKDFTTASHYLSTRIGVKRKHGESVLTIHNTPKKRRKKDGELQDVYCWECHKGCVEDALDCLTCPRTFHSRCIDSRPEVIEKPREGGGDNWICPVCTLIAKAECSDTRSWAMQLLTPEQLCPLLGFALRRMLHSDSEPFQNPVPASLVPEYYDLIFHPMDLSTLEKNIAKSQYASTEAFMEDAKWILHNCIIFHGPSSKYCQDAKLIIKICKHEMTEIELCPDCYKHSYLRQDNWFSEPCTNPHCLVWAKLKGFPYWPAKALRVSSGNANVDVRFFGAHDRAWIPSSQVFLLSKESPVPTKNVKKHGLDSALVELKRHLMEVEAATGDFQFAPPRTEFKPDHLVNCPLFGNADRQGLANQSQRRTALRAVSPTPSGSSISAKSDRGDFIGLANWAPKSELPDNEHERSDRSVSRNESEADAEPSPAKVSKMSDEDNSNGVFEGGKLEERLSGAALEELDSAQLRSTPGRDKKSPSGPQGAVARKSIVPTFNEDSPLLERIKNSLERERREEEGEDSSSTPREGSPAPLPNGQDRTSPAVPKDAKKRNLSQLVEKMQQSKNLSDTPPTLKVVSPAHSPGVGVSAQQQQQPKKSSVIITHEKMNPPRFRPTSSPHNSALPSRVAFAGKNPVKITHAAEMPSSSRAASSDNPSSEPFKLHLEKISSFLTGALEEMWEDAAARRAEAASSGGAGASASHSTSTPSHSKELSAAQGDLAKLQFVHKSALASLKQDTKVALSELKGSFEGDKFRSLEELRKTFREEKQKAVAETKSKQWCAYCQKEAVFYCCWNTSYCDYPCQQRHWPKHQNSCAQVRSSSSSSTEQTARPNTNGAQPQNYFASRGITASSGYRGSPISMQGANLGGLMRSGMGAGSNMLSRH